MLPSVKTSLSASDGSAPLAQAWMKYTSSSEEITEEVRHQNLSWLCCAMRESSAPRRDRISLRVSPSGAQPPAISPFLP